MQVWASAWLVCPRNTARKTARFDLSSFDNVPHSAASLCREFSSELVAPRVSTARCLQLPVMVDAVAALIALRGREERRKVPRPGREAVDESLSKYIPLGSILNPPNSFSARIYLGQKLDVYQVFASLTEDELLEMARLHTTVEFILEDMVHSFLELRPDTQTPKEKNVVLSPSETFRMQRALYRLEIHRLLFNSRDLPSFEGLDYFEDVHLDDGDQWSFFLSLFSPWEMEEIRCVLMYIFRVYKELPGATVFDDWCELSPDENEDPLSHLYDYGMILITG
ncbi:hypothetical protein BDV33DRAFT_195796 [Aspergillus novoparasiticus]|uniref:Uncharacterized protein n=1 Tax=Aspergillus novoparasiticus TaxID=986946 RepID=A0A5N6ED99_9EURO|nr:hypothetical protein BDV33DRAFT_195796 [Aspergillus novoparasiticus]